MKPDRWQQITLTTRHWSVNQASGQHFSKMPVQQTKVSDDLAFSPNASPRPHANPDQSLLGCVSHESLRH
jgi:hypothetical protein